jgi:SAM-dependent methyltransferase
MNVVRQIEAGKLVCPQTLQPLRIAPDASLLRTADGERTYPLLGGMVPVLLDEAWSQSYVEASQTMLSEYYAAPEGAWSTPLSPLRRLKAAAREAEGVDYRTEGSIRAFERTLGDPGDDVVLLSVGGGPRRIHPGLTNLNIGPFPNVDVVADGHQLPYADGSVAGIHCEAVLEHLYDPARAVGEMHRVLEPGGLVFAATPFMQAYHGYPHHYQNFTLTGHVRLFEKRGFEIVDSGPCVGPMFALTRILSVFAGEFVPGRAGRLLSRLVGASGILVNRLDRRLNRRPNAHILASTTYVLARKG